ncbi:hypothetical protein ED236_07595 [Pseudomethylobacillus aquaticus]|uniref:Uncharacterized protein n=1 Tax=Pseudomethylobacillus aquaticus TaxID=2676064 RepID=A0A3N0V189_9PROT|nr:hypothetical protein [Pseudomethylobacillus aquaticus]ROH86291.1 hypothetical protein ED236_07595 [Pseudomethylobacillus aquaticus]
MAAGTILTVLANIPWGTVVDNAPKVADGAAKLWNTVSRWNKAGTASGSRPSATVRTGLSDNASLAARLQSAEESVQHLNQQMQASTALIKELAEQNTLLVRRVELHRQRLVRLTMISIGVGSLLLGLNLYLLLR